MSQIQYEKILFSLFVHSCVVMLPQQTYCFVCFFAYASLFTKLGRFAFQIQVFWLLFGKSWRVCKMLTPVKSFDHQQFFRLNKCVCLSNFAWQIKTRQLISPRNKLQV
jgi:hypothetical protein